MLCSRATSPTACTVYRKETGFPTGYYEWRGVEVAEVREFRAVWEAIEGLLPAESHRYSAVGMTGEILRRAGDVSSLHDLGLLLLPGLATVGIRAECVALPEEDTLLLRLIRERLRRGLSVPVLGFTRANAFASTQAQSPPSGTDSLSLSQQIAEAMEEAETSDDGEWMLQLQSLLVGIEALDGSKEVRLVLREAGQEVERETTIPELRETFTHMVRLYRGKGGGRSGRQRREILLRWLAFAAAFPERVVTAAEEDQPRRDKIVGFLSELRGRRRDLPANRLREAIQYFAWANIPMALYRLRESVLRELHLPPAVHRALLLPEVEPLSDTERRELIYLARAGTREMKVLAARRLVAEQEADDAWATCEQLRHAPDAWVRAAATPLNPTTL
jgi:hypothetical protein